MKGGEMDISQAINILATAFKPDVAAEKKPEQNVINEATLMFSKSLSELRAGNLNPSITGALITAALGSDSKYIITSTLSACIENPNVFEIANTLQQINPDISTWYRQRIFTDEFARKFFMCIPDESKGGVIIFDMLCGGNGVKYIIEMAEDATENAEDATENAKGIAEFITGNAEGFAEFITGNAEGIAEGFAEFITGNAEFITENAEGFAAFITGNAEGIGEGFAAFITENVEGIGEGFAEFITGNAASIAEFIATNAVDFTKFIAEFINGNVKYKYIALKNLVSCLMCIYKFLGNATAL
jgi:hypothetical protein